MQHTECPGDKIREQLAAEIESARIVNEYTAWLEAGGKDMQQFIDNHLSRR